jgi:hypothetical protein
MVQSIQSPIGSERVGKRKKTKKNAGATHGGYAERDLSQPKLCARLSSGRPYEAVLFESHGRKSGLVTIITALIDRRTGMLALVAEAQDLGASEASELRELARSGFGGDPSAEDPNLPSPPMLPPLAIVPIEVAKIRLSRAILATRIGGHAIPSWLTERADLVGDPTDPSSRIDDIYLCFACDNALPVSEQLARAARLGSSTARTSQRPPVCPICRGEAETDCAEGEAWLGRAWLMVAAKLPRRALVCAARAEGAKVASNRLDALRGAALLALGDSRAAASHLARASSVATPDHRVAGWLMTLDEQAA